METVESKTPLMMARLYSVKHATRKIWSLGVAGYGRRHINSGSLRFVEDI
jgi:hypothetical protein